MESIHVTTDADRIMTLQMDAPEKSVNTLTPSMLEDLGRAIDAVEQEKPGGVIFASAKGGSFIVGADLFEIRKMDRGQIESFLAAGQALFERIARLGMPTVAAINGDCLGGGLELALACRHRVAADTGSISIGLPEVKLGILPGWGGTTRLPRLIGLPAALRLLLAGKTLPPRKAQTAGIIDEVVRPDALEAAAKRLARSGGRRRRHGVSRMAERIGAVRNRIFAAAEAKTRHAARGHYPAPLKVIDVVRTGYERGMAAGLEAERRGLGELIETDAAQNLMRLFFLRQRGKRAIFERLSAKPAAVNDAAVIGGGTMGAGIIHGLIRAGIMVRLVEVSHGAVSAALVRIHHLIQEDIAAGRMTDLEARHAMNRVVPTTDWTGLKRADIVIEAIIEQLEAKREVFVKLDKLTRPDAVLASNTSSLEIGQMAEGLSHPNRVVGLHFFNPVPKMPLVEVVRAGQSDDAALATAAATAGRLGKTPILVADGPGFLINRILIPYLSEALMLASEGESIVTIDRAMKDWGMPMGAFELIDEIGLDVAKHVLDSLAEQMSQGMSAPAGIDRALEHGWLGKKTGCGFYDYRAKKKTGSPPVNMDLARFVGSRIETASPQKTAHQNGPPPAETLPNGETFAAADESIQWRLVLPMINESARILEEGVVDSADTIDLATVLGLGLAPFRGGLAHFADTAGTPALVSRLDELAHRHGPRFSAAPLLRKLAEMRKPLSAFNEAGGKTAPSLQPQANTDGHP